MATPPTDCSSSESGRNFSGKDRSIFLCLLLLSSLIFAIDTQPSVAAELSIKALDHNGLVVEGVRFAFNGIESLPTTGSGVTSLSLPDLDAGESITLDLPSDVTREWFLIDAVVHAPARLIEGPAEVVVMKQAVLLTIASLYRNATLESARPGESLSEGQRRQLLEQLASEQGLTPVELTAAIAAFRESAETRKDRGIAAYLAGEYAEAEEDLAMAANQQETDVVETLSYLGGAQFAQVKYERAAATFRKAVALRGDDLDLLDSLGSVLRTIAAWDEAEPVLRKFLELSEQQNGPHHPTTAHALSDLADLFETTNRLTEAEPLIRRALRIGEASLGHYHPQVATYLNQLAVLLLFTNRYSEAEPLMRRALAIVEQANLGEQDPRVATFIKNLGVLLRFTNRHSEAEPLMRRALEISEATFGDHHPVVEGYLNDLAHLLRATNRHSEAETLMRRALEFQKQASRMTILALGAVSTPWRRFFWRPAAWTRRSRYFAVRWRSLRKALEKTIKGLRLSLAIWLNYCRQRIAWKRRSHGFAVRWL